ncbi:YncE family protein [Shewanella marina]|uniref:YncE family protein n=1 Tax=Shewanella marina TaxID=487319 RepID=UPI000471902F|nr:YncE family protein [Shewanella marina]
MLKTIYATAISLFFSASINLNAEANNVTNYDIGHIVSADRASGQLSVINTNTDQVERTIQLPQNAEPMYVVYKDNRVFVGDRTNHQVHVYDSYGFNHLTSINIGQGAFHMWAAKQANLLLVNNDIDNTVSVIDTNNLSLISTLTLPDDIVSQGYKPHDIVVTDNGKQAFVSFVDGQPSQDYVIKINTRNGQELARSQVGGDPHLFLSAANKHQLFIVSQEANSVTKVRQSNLSFIKSTEVTGAHGVFNVANRLYLTNITDGGQNALNTLNAKRLKVIDRDNTLSGVAHNLVVTSGGSKIYITHSGSNNSVSVFDTYGPKHTPIFKQEIEVGNNPFGIAFIPH